MSRAISTISLSQSHTQANLIKNKFKKLAQEIKDSAGSPNLEPAVKESFVKDLTDKISHYGFMMENPTWTFSPELRNRLNDLIDQSKSITNMEELKKLYKSVGAFEHDYTREFEKEQARTGIFDESQTGNEIEEIKRKYPQSTQNQSKSPSKPISTFELTQNNLNGLFTSIPNLEKNVCSDLTQNYSPVGKVQLVYSITISSNKVGNTKPVNNFAITVAKANLNYGPATQAVLNDMSKFLTEKLKTSVINSLNSTIDQVGNQGNRFIVLEPGILKVTKEYNF